MTKGRATRLLGLLLAVVLLAGCGGGGGGGSAQGGGSASSPLGSVFGGSGGPGGSGDPTGTNGSTSPLVTLRPPVPVKFQAGQLVPNAAAGKFKLSGQSAYSTKAADFNSDGLPDLLVGGTVQLQQPDHTYGAPISIGEVPADAGGLPVSIFIRDVTGDGLPDVISASFYSTTVLDPAVCVFVSNGDGTFKPRISVPVSAPPLDAAFGDIDLDGRVDMVVCFRNRVYWHHGNGDGTFGPEQTVATGIPFAQAILCEDLNGDGHDDVFIISSEPVYGNLPAHVCLSNGDGTFTTLETPAVDPESIDVASGDFNGDGKQDVAIAAAHTRTYPGTHAAIWVLLGNGDGTFQTPSLAFPDRRSFHLVTGDLNGDGLDDIVFSFDEPQGTNVLLSKGDGTFTQGLSYSGGLPTYFSTLHEMDGDGRLDLLVPGDGGSAILKGNGDGTFDGRRSYDSGGNADTMSAGDVTGDGCPDVAVTNTDNNTVSLFVSRGDGTLAPPTMLPFPNGVGACAMADLDGDGRAELIVAESNGVSVLRGTASGVGSPTHYDADTGGAVACVVADLDHDGIADVVVGHTGSARGLVVFHGNGDGTLGAITPLPIDDEILSLICGDVTEDGFTDVIACCQQSLCVADSLSGARVDATQPAFAFPPWATRFPAIGQMTLLPASNLENDYGQYGSFASDLHLDLVFGYGVTLRVQTGNGQGQFPEYGVTDVRQLPSNCAAVADMDLDGLPDVVSGSDMLAIYRGTGSVLQQTPPLKFPLQDTLRQALVADMNHDGLPDVLALQEGSQHHRVFSVLLRKP